MSDKQTNNNYTVSQLNKESLAKERLLRITEKFKQAKILFYGDLILDEYLRGVPERISREAPVIILDYIGSRYTLGGGANAAANARSLGAQTSLLGVTGADKTADILQEKCQQAGIKLHNIVATDRHTTLKTRVVSSSSSDPDTGTVLKQQVLRIDRQTKSGLTEEQYKNLLGTFNEVLSEHDACLLSDYRGGVLTDEGARGAVARARAQNKTIIADANGNFQKFSGATSMTPNQPDVAATLAKSINSDEELYEAGFNLLEELNLPFTLITRGAKGMALFTHEKQTLDLIPAFNLSEVFDVSGAGDTVSATYTVALACGASHLEAAILGNLAASIVVRKYGTATCTLTELQNLIRSL